ncbi:hypothetical protein KMP13_00895 [Epibacterium ulvae]|uniref:calcium-binding protein n=1 Tax=Epibacterium ulvae TaxID=1156985 RepID=UPI001BFC9979|nr:calcium-binding protein [Epibacterium ulvae]MBT8152476.1 hypothetical protein [Epibacterium ulvae]
MFGIAILATLVLGGAIIALDDDDDNNTVDESNSTEEPELRVETDTATEGGDLLSFAAEDDVIDALGGDDEVRAGAGDDTVFGGTGDDTLFGQGGNDDLRGGEGNDDLFGSGGQDTLSGDAGDDNLIASAGADTIFSGEGDDIAFGGSGSDSILGGAGNDFLYGGELESEPNSEDLATLRDPDAVAEMFIVGDDIADTLNGGVGDDTLILDEADQGRGGDGDDTFILYTDGAVNDPITVTDFTAEDDTLAVSILEESGLTVDDFSVLNDTDTGDALIMQDGDVLARVIDAGDTLTIDDVAFILLTS